MKYFPLIWAALRRKPIRAGVTFLSVTVAFTLFGLMIGLDATMERMAAQAHADRFWTNGRFNMSGMPITVARRIASLPGVKKSTVMSYVNGYVGDPKNRTGIVFFDDQYAGIYPDQVPQSQADLLRQDKTAVIMNRTAAEQLHKKVGDRFTLISAQTQRADGTHNWQFTVAGVYEDLPLVPWPMISGNYDYYENSVPLANQGKIDEVDAVATDPVQTPALAQRVDAIFANSANPTRSMTEKQGYAVDGGDINIETLTKKIAVIGLLMMLLLTANVLAQSVRERLAEFATLRTLGFSTARLISLVLVEAALPCLVGAICGVALAGWLAPHLPDLMPPGYGIPTPGMSEAVFLWALAAAIGVALASTALPILRLSRLDIATALSRHA